MPAPSRPTWPLPYRAEGHCGKNDANDAAAICEAASRPHVRFVPVKSVEQQSLLCVHRLREGLKADRTACINRIGGLLLEFGIAVPNGSRALRLVLDDLLEDGANEMNGLARMTLRRAQAQWRELDEHLAWCDERLAAHEQENPEVRRAGQQASSTKPWWHVVFGPSPREWNGALLSGSYLGPQRQRTCRRLQQGRL